MARPCQLFEQLRPIVARARGRADQEPSDLVQIGAELVQLHHELDLNAPDVEPNRPELVQIAASFVQLRPELDFNGPELEPTAPDFAQIAPDLEQSAPELKPNGPELVQIVPELDDNAAELDPNAPKLGDHAGELDQQGRTSGQLAGDSPGASRRRIPVYAARTRMAGLSRWPLRLRHPQRLHGRHQFALHLRERPERDADLHGEARRR